MQLTKEEKEEYKNLLKKHTRDDGTGLKDDMPEADRQRLSELQGKVAEAAKIEMKQTMPEKKVYKAGQPWTDSKGRQHAGNCNAHPAKSIRCKCDCSAMPAKRKNEQEINQRLRDLGY